ncbi:hypothetical protein H5410_050935 [Solanum commersonii]|uniref:Uncharacterized protein n=1 Tax=Solanum commersonii TaxID=4109 RepID=A0A9J5WZ22_SOLCO|nr:hypothetical protein H5410_050935 [Solanum commersonii]
MEQAYCNNNGKIWFFWNSDMACNILEAEDQHITCELKHVKCNANFHVTFIYAKCKEHLRRPLWDKLIQDEQHIKYFKFLHCWTESDTFMNTVEECWSRTVQGNPMWRLHQKMKRLATTPSAWSRKEFGDIFSIVEEYEEQVREAEEKIITNNSEDNRAKEFFLDRKIE